MSRSWRLLAIAALLLAGLMADSSLAAATSGPPGSASTPRSACLSPPPGFTALTATPAELSEYGLPQRPPGTNTSGAVVAWATAVDHAKHRVCTTTAGSGAAPSVVFGSQKHHVKASRAGTGRNGTSTARRLVSACEAVVVPPAKDAAGDSVLAVKTSVLRDLEKSGNRVLEKIAKSIRRARHHHGRVSEAKYVRDELHLASSTCHKLGLHTVE